MAEIRSNASGMSTKTTGTTMWAAFFGTDEQGATEAPKILPVLEEGEDETEQPTDEAFECDYERDCSPLYRAIENAMEESEFEPIVKFLDTGYWKGTFFADGISPIDQAKTWVTKFDPQDENNVKWSQLPLHLAIVCGAPPSVIGRLVKLYPQALRCTDDQHMLPLHLALRHNASDEVVAYLLMQFPDAVNAKGKSSRTAVDCALRAKDKLRGKILEIFIERSKGKKSSGIVREQNQLKAQLELKEEELDDLKRDLESFAANFESMKSLKHTVEQDLLMKIQELERAKAENEADTANKMEALQSEKALEAVEIEKTFAESQAELAHKIEQLESDKMLETMKLEKKVQVLEKLYAESVGSEKKHRVEATALRLELDTMHGRIAKSVSPDDLTSLQDELKSLESYRMEHSRSQAGTAISSLKEELELTMKAAKKTKTDSKSTKKELESELKAIKRNLMKLEKDESKAKTAGELNSLRGEVDTLRAELKQRAEASKTLVDITALKKTMERELKNSEGKTKEELAALKKAVEDTTMSELQDKTSDELATLKNELEDLKKNLTSKDLLTKTQQDLDELRLSLKEGLLSADAKHKADLTAMKKSVDELKLNLETTDSSEEVIAVKQTLGMLKDELKKKEAKSVIMAEVIGVKDTLESELKKAEGKTQQELLSMKKAIRMLNEKELSNKDVHELTKIKGELGGIKSNLKAVEEAAKTKDELETLKKNIAAEIRNSTGKTEKELAMMKEAVDAVDMEQKESKNLKKSLTEEIKQANVKTENELLRMKKVLDGISVKKLESKNKVEWDAIRKEMESLKGDLKETQAKSISTEIDSIKKTVDALNLDAIEKKNDMEFQRLRKEMSGMRATFQQKDDVMSKDIEAMKKVNSPRKKGLKKFFTRRFARSKGGSILGRSTSTETGNLNIPTIAPPSLAIKKSDSQSVINEERSADSDDSAADAKIMAQLSKSMTGDDDVVVETVQSEESSKQAAPVKLMSPSQKPPLGSFFRKVQSMDSPKASSFKAPSFAEKSLTRTQSKTIVEDSGEVELEKVDTNEEESSYDPSLATSISASLSESVSAS